MKKKELDGIIIKKQCNFSWLTGGNNFVNIATEVGENTLLVTFEKIYLIANNIEYPRIISEELNSNVITSQVFKWYDSSGEERVVKEIINDGKLGSDIKEQGTIYIENKIRELRSTLCEEEISRYRKLGLDNARCIENVCKEIEPSQSERTIAGKVANNMYARGIVPVVLLVAVDERIYKYRHPLPTAKKLKKHAMLVGLGRRNGLMVSTSRLVYFGELPEELRKKQRAVTQIDALFIKESRPGKKISDIFRQIVKEYETRVRQ